MVQSPAMTQPASLLDYSPPRAPAPPDRRRRRWGWLVLSLPSLVVPFVPFACSASPVGVIAEAAGDAPRLNREMIAIVGLAVPLTLGALAALWRARVLWRP